MFFCDNISLDFRKDINMKIKICFITFIIIISLAVFSSAALDLKFTSAITTSPVSPVIGDTVTFAVAFKAEGDTATNVKIIGSVDGIQVHERTFASIPAGATRTDSFTWTAAAGNHNVIFTLDPNHTSGDSNYNNNTVSTTLNLTTSDKRKFLKVNPNALKPKNIRDDLNADPNVINLKPDLIVKSVSLAPIATEDNTDNDDLIQIAYPCYQKWGLRVRVRNDGDKKTEAEFLITVMIDGTDEYFYDVFGPITLDAKHEYEFYKAGYTTYKHTVRVVTSVDSSHKIAESDETNNLLTITQYCD
jgi:hypothetical protein